jgi:LacI family repressor for deo operon, udp, cdd, tsx, nupC, and nupG
VREVAWRSALASAGLAPGPLGHVVHDPRAAALNLLLQEPTAVVCSSDALALELYRAARELGLSIPDDVSVVGFDDSALASSATPALTSVRVDYVEFGTAAATALLAAIAGDPAPVYSPSVPEVVVRASTALRRRR